jgi:hypothetical protein
MIDWPLVEIAPIGDNEDDYDVLADGKVVGRIFVSQAAPRIGNGCGVSPMAITKTARRPAATSRRMRLRWPRSPRAGGDDGRIAPYSGRDRDLYHHLSSSSRPQEPRLDEVPRPILASASAMYVRPTSTVFGRVQS